MWNPFKKNATADDILKHVIQYCQGTYSGLIDYEIELWEDAWVANVRVNNLARTRDDFTQLVYQKDGTFQSAQLQPFSIDYPREDKWVPYNRAMLRGSFSV